MRLGDDWLSTGPDAPPTHWNQVFLPMETPLELAVGDVLSFHLKRPEFGEWTWTTQHGQHQQRLSTFLSQPITPQSIAKASDAYSAKLSERGEATLWLLQQMDGKTTTAELTEQLQVRHSKLFVSDAEALRFVKSLIGRSC